jgi:hypothetical protein
MLTCEFLRSRFDLFELDIDSPYRILHRVTGKVWYIQNAEPSCPHVRNLVDFFSFALSDYDGYRTLPSFLPPSR